MTQILFDLSYLDRFLERLGGTSLWRRCASCRLESGQSPTSSGMGEEPPSRSRKRSRNERSNRIWVIPKRAPASSFASKRRSSVSRSSADGLTATPQ